MFEYVRLQKRSYRVLPYAVAYKRTYSYIFIGVSILNICG